MFPKRNNTRAIQLQHKRQRGSSLVIAIFVIIVMSLIASSLVNMLISSHHNLAFEVLGSRAHQAAQSGAQWKLGALFPVVSGASGATHTVHNTCAAVSTAPPTITNTQGFAGCNISKVACLDYVHEGTRYYIVTSTGVCELGFDGDGDLEVVSRTVEVEAHSIN